MLVTADHGDNLYEEGTTLGHGLTFNGPLHANHVPLIFHLPGHAPQEVPAIVRTIDIAPTIADLTGVKKPASWEGRSFAGWLDGTENPSSRPFYGETGFPFVQFRVPGITRPPLPPMDGMTGIDPAFNYQFVLKKEYEQPLVAAKQRCLATDRWKLICTPTDKGTRHFTLHDRTVSGDDDLSEQHPAVFQSMKTALEKWMDEKVETPLEEMIQ